MEELNPWRGVKANAVTAPGAQSDIGIDYDLEPAVNSLPIIPAPKSGAVILKFPKPAAVTESVLRLAFLREAWIAARACLVSKASASPRTGQSCGGAPSGRGDSSRYQAGECDPATDRRLETAGYWCRPPAQHPGFPRHRGPWNPQLHGARNDRGPAR